MSSAEPRVLVIGGGIGGLCLAQGLKRAGVEVEVHERDRSRDDRLEGYRIHIDPDGAKALHACLPPEIWEALLGRTVDLGSFRFLTEHLDELVVLDGQARRPEAAGPLDRSHAIDRVTLRDLLLTGLDDVVRFGKKFERYERTGDGRITAFFSDGTTATGDVLVGADGVGSRVRQQYLPQARRVDTGAIGIGFKLPLTAEVRSWLTPPLSTGRSMIMAPVPYFLSISVFDRGESADAPPGAEYENYVGSAFVARRAACPPDLDDLDGPGLQRMVSGLIDGWHPHLRRIIADSDPGSVLLVPYLTSVPLDPWESTNITLLGDAVHSMSPVGGLGGNTALRDADRLCRALVAARDGGTPIPAAIHQYETAMREYGFAAVRKALRYQRQGLRSGRVATAATRVFFRLMNGLMQRRRGDGGTAHRSLTAHHGARENA